MILVRAETSERGYGGIAPSGGGAGGRDEAGLSMANSHGEPPPAATVLMSSCGLRILTPAVSVSRTWAGA